MGYINKIKNTQIDARNAKYNTYITVFDVNINKVFKDKLKLLSKFIDHVIDEYKEFLQNFDGAEIDDFRFLSLVDDSYIESIDSLIKDYGEIYAQIGEENPFKPGGNRLPIALDSGGNVIYLNKKGEVWIFYNDSGDDEFIASSFEEFMNDVIFGEKYREYYNLSDEECEEDEWYQYLKKKGWVKS